MVILGRARVSSLEQSQNSHALEQQIARLTGAGATEILSITASGAGKKQLKQLYDRLAAGDVTEVVATRIDRITRSLPALREFAEMCVSKGINLRILDQQIDLKTPQGKLMLNFLGALAEWELDQLTERVNHGWNHLRKEKRAPGIIPFGYKRENDRYAPDDTIYKSTGKNCWAIARELVEAFLSAGTVRGATRIMAEKYGMAIGRGDFPREIGLKYWLENPVISGHIGYFYRHRQASTQVIPDQHKPLVTPAEAAQIRRLLAFSVQYRETAKEDWETATLAGLVYCGKCGAKYKGIRKYKRNAVGELLYKRRSWYCSARYLPIPTCDRAVPGIREEVLEAAVIEGLVSKAQSIAGMVDQPMTFAKSPEIEALETTLRSLDGLGDNAAIVAARNEIAVQIEALRIGPIADSAGIAEDRELFGIAANLEFWQWLSAQQRRQYFKRFIRRIIVDDGCIQRIEFWVD
jgi:site-specific DNA recombinase